MEYAIGVLCTLMGARVRFGHDPNDEAEGQAIIHYGVPASGSPPSLLIKCEEHFWGRVGSGSDPTPEGAVEWQGVVYPRWEMSGNSREPGFDESRVFSVDPVAAAFFLVSRIEELRSSVIDRHGRFPAEQAWTVRMGLIERALVHDYALAILSALGDNHDGAKPSPWPDGCQFALAFTHDVDRLRMHGSLWRDLRCGIGGLRFRGGAGAAMRRAKSLVGTRVLGHEDPYSTIESMCAEHDLRGFKSTWFWIATEPSVKNSDYHPNDPHVVELMSRIQAGGHEIGLHGSYESFDQPERLAEEKRALESAASHVVSATRQHYLRFRIDRTWDAHHNANLSMDSSLGFAERIGFRAGIAVPFRPWDFRRRCAHDIWEVPTIMMDGTAREYMGLTPSEAISSSRQVLREIQRVRGAAAVLWHNSSLNDIDWAGWQPVYESWLDFAHVSGAWSCTMSEMTNSWQSHVSKRS